MAHKRDIFININKNGLKWGFFAHHIKEGEMVSTFIPAFDLYYSSPNKDEANKRAKIMVKSFLNFWIQQQGFRAFVLQMLKLGFKTPDATALKQLLERKNINAKLSASNTNIPDEFLEAETFLQEDQMEVAV